MINIKFGCYKKIKSLFLCAELNFFYIFVIIKPKPINLKSMNLKPKNLNAINPTPINPKP